MCTPVLVSGPTGGGGGWGWGTQAKTAKEEVEATAKGLMMEPDPAEPADPRGVSKAGQVRSGSWLDTGAGSGSGSDTPRFVIRAAPLLP